MPEQIINIFFAYTNDSYELLDTAKREIDIINRSIGGNIHINIKEWKSNTVAAMGNPEENILKQMPIEDSNFFVGLFRFKYGEPTGNKNPDTGKPYQSGMEEEFFTAYRLWKKHKRPEIIVFKSIEDVPRKYALDYNNQKAIESFFKRFSAQGKNPGLYKEYRSKTEFGEIFRQNILTYIMKSVINNKKPKNGFMDIFFDEENYVRNEIKQQELQNSSFIKLQANSAYSFLVPRAIHSSLMRKGLDRGMRVQIIVQNPWSANALRSLLRRDDFLREKDYTDYLKDRLPADKLLAVYQNSHWQTGRLNLCLKSYESLKKEYNGLIELRLSDRDLSDSILMTDQYLFYEPYFSILETDKKDISVFEIQIAKESAVYRDTGIYFDKLWDSSYTYRYFKRHEDFYKKRLKDYLEEKGD